jgi:hypothetical protein
MQTLGITQSVCGACRSLVPAKVITDGRDVYFRKLCPEHGETQCLVRRDVAAYLRCQRYVKPAWTPLEFAGDSRSPCPAGCGFCRRHEQHMCMPIVEITSGCDLDCPVCLVSAGTRRDMTFEAFKRLLDAFIRAERQVDVLNLSGGEPLLHPQLLAFLDEAQSRPEIVRVSISTNGLRLLSDPGLIRQLHTRDVVVSLQFDGFEERAYEILRGRKLLRQKFRILDALAEEGISTSLTMTAAGQVNDDQFPRMLDYVFSHEHVVSLMVQPIAFEGRAAGLKEVAKRLTIPDVLSAIGQAGHPAVAASDFVPLPCSHPLCFSLAFYLMLDSGQAVAVNRLSDAVTILDALSNRVVFGLDAGEHDRLKQMINELWSGPAGVAPDSEAVMQTLRSMLREMSCTCFDPRRAFALAERRVKSIFIHAFQDADTFDLARVRRCCQPYAQADGRIIPACVHNVMRRGRCGNSSANTGRQS